MHRWAMWISLMQGGFKSCLVNRTSDGLFSLRSRYQLSEKRMIGMIDITVTVHISA